MSNEEKHIRLRRINNCEVLGKVNEKIKGGVKETRMERKMEKGKRKRKRGKGKDEERERNKKRKKEAKRRNGKEIKRIWGRLER